MTRRILILGGSTEGFAIAEKLAAMPGLEPVTSFAGRTKKLRPVAGEFRVGGFGGIDGLHDYILKENISAIIDATHPFASQIKSNCESAAQKAGIPAIHIIRPEWSPQPGDRWSFANNMKVAAVKLEKGPVFLTIGRMELSAFEYRRDLRLIARVIDPPEEEGLDHIELVFARGPFKLDDERAFLADNKIKSIVTKNSGGDAAMAKLTAAREMGITVIMVSRPAPPDGLIVASTDEALEELRNGA